MVMKVTYMFKVREHTAVFMHCALQEESTVVCWRKNYFEFLLNSYNLKGFCTEIDSFELANRRKSVKNGKQWKKHPKSDGSTPKNHHFSTVNIKLLKILLQWTITENPGTCSTSQLCYCRH